MGKVTAADVSKIRKMTGAGMMNCKNALVEADGDFDKAISIIRKKGLSIANKRSDREASEGAVIAKVTEDGKRGAIIALNCETDFVAKNDDFVAFANTIIDVVLDKNPANLEELKQLPIGDLTIEAKLVEQTAVVGERLEVSSFEKVEAEKVVAYIHNGNQLATIVGVNKNADTSMIKDIAMQVASMDPVALDKEDVSNDIIEKELEIGRDQARKAGKPEAMIEKIATGKLGKYFKENTLLNQQFIKDNKMNIKQYLQNADKDLTVTSFKRISIIAS